MNISIHFIGYIQAVLQLLILFTLFGHSYKLRYVFSFPVIAAAVNSLAFRSLGMLAATVLHYLLFFAFFRLVCKSSIRSLVLLAAQFALTAIVELASNTVLSMMGRSIYFSLNATQEHLHMRMVGLLLLVAIYAWAKILKQRRKLSPINEQLIWHLLLNLFIIAMLIYPSMIYIEHREISVPQSIWAYYLLFAFALVVFCAYIYFRLLRGAKQAEELRLSGLYIAALKQSYENLRGIRHDIDNILSSIHGYIGKGDQAGLLALANSLRGDLEAIAAPADLAQNLEDVPHIFGLLMQKMVDAEQHNVKLHISAGRILAESLLLDPPDCCRVLGSLIDNAIEAAANSTGRLVTMDLFRLDGATYFHITNTVDGEVDISRIYKLGESSKAGHTGIGLHQTAKIIGRYQRQNPNIKLDTRYLPGEFHQTLRA